MDSVSYSLAAKQSKRISAYYHTGESAPTEPELGMEWAVPSSGKIYKYINDGTTDIWIDVASAGSNAAIQKSVEYVAGTPKDNYTGDLSTYETNGYQPGYLEVVVEGMVLGHSEYTATDGQNVILNVARTVGDVVRVLVFGTFLLADHYTKAESDTLYEPVDATILKDIDIGVNVEAYDATILKDADIGTSVLAPDGDGSGLTGLSAGKALQMVSTEITTTGTTALTIPADATIPQQTEGYEILTLAITPKSATSKLVIQAQALFGETANVGNLGIAALFRDSIADALAVGINAHPVSLYPYPHDILHVEPSNATALTTFKLRIGMDGGTLRWNGGGATQYYGAASKTILTITEIDV